MNTHNFFQILSLASQCLADCIFSKLMFSKQSTSLSFPLQVRSLTVSPWLRYLGVSRIQVGEAGTVCLYCTAVQRVQYTVHLYTAHLPHSSRKRPVLEINGIYSYDSE